MRASEPPMKEPRAANLENSTAFVGISVALLIRMKPSKSFFVRWMLYHLRYEEDRRQYITYRPPGLSSPMNRIILQTHASGRTTPGSASAPRLAPGGPCTGG